VPTDQVSKGIDANHIICVDLSFGDAGKGTIVDWLCSGSGRGDSGRPVAVVRFNGGGQAGHNVVSSDGRHHTFSQFGSGSMRPGVRTFLSRYMLVDPLALMTEAAHLELIGVSDIMSRLAIDREALVVTPYHVAANRLRESLRGDGRHGSCGMGIGETASMALKAPEEALVVGDLFGNRLGDKLGVIRGRVADEFGALADELVPVDNVVAAYRDFAAKVVCVGSEHLAKLMRLGGVIFEGAQGVALDENVGFHPYTTWSTTTFHNAEALLAEAGRDGAALRLGLIRAYTTRHGPGPMPTYDESLSGLVDEPFNVTSEWQREFRIGHFDSVLHRYCVEACGGVDGLAVTHLDSVERYGKFGMSEGYVGVDGVVSDELMYPDSTDRMGQEVATGALMETRGERLWFPDSGRAWSEAIACALGAEVMVESRGPTAADKVVPVGT
jgi:adenylosuccinate synthase